MDNVNKLNFKRKSKQRDLILEELKKLKTHPTAIELYDVIRKIIPNISLGTVYRNLELLAQNGIIQKLERAGAEARFDADISNHCHGRCVKCGRIQDLPCNLVTSQVNEISDGMDFKILGHEIEFYGLCARCKDN